MEISRATGSHCDSVVRFSLFSWKKKKMAIRYHVEEIERRMIDVSLFWTWTEGRGRFSREIVDEKFQFSTRIYFRSSV